jgi:hypothetical protein
MYCPKCGTKNSDDASFCTNCGNRLLEGDPQNAAPPAQNLSPTFSTSNEDSFEATSKKAQEDRQMLHDYIVTELPKVEVPGQQRLAGNILKGMFEGLREMILRKGGVVSGTQADDVGREIVKREAVFKQQVLLQIASRYLSSKPWITYLTAIKLTPFLKRFDIETEEFSDFSDKQLLDKLIRYGDELETRSSNLMSDETKAQLTELFRLEELKDPLWDAFDVAKTINSSPYKELIIAKLRGEAISLEARTNNPPVRPSTGVMLFFGTLLLIVGGFPLIFSYSVNDVVHQTVRHWSFAPIIIGGVFLFIVHIRSREFDAEFRDYSNWLKHEQMRILTIQSSVDELCREFELKVIPILATINVTLEEALANIAVVIGGAREWLKYISEMRESFAET